MNQKKWKQTSSVMSKQKLKQWHFFLPLFYIFALNEKDLQVMRAYGKGE
jgi:hypothetical protein